jgi:outer membrane protein assembly factor BamA
VRRNVYLHLSIAALSATLVTPFLSNATSQECDSSSSRPLNASQQIKINIASVEFPVDDTLSDELHMQLRRTVQNEKFSVAAGTPDTDWLDELSEVVVRDVLVNAGYFKAQTRTIPYLIRAEAHQRFYAVRIESESGPLYRLGEIQFENVTVFDQADLRRQFRLRAGEPFDISMIREGIESITRLYSTKGYIDETILPQIDVDDEKQQINMIMRISEEVQYRVGTVQFLGLDDGMKNRLVDQLEPGRVFNMPVLKSFLDADERTVTINRNTPDRTVDIALDVRQKGCVERIRQIFE